MAYSQEDKERIFNSILSEIEEGASLRSAIRKLKTIPLSTFDLWINGSDDLMEQYVRARDIRTDVIFEQILTIADANETDVLGVDDNGKPIVNNDIVQRNRLQIDARKWMLGKMNKRKYGDHLDMTTDGKAIQSAPSAINVRIIENNDEE